MLVLIYKNNLDHLLIISFILNRKDKNKEYSPNNQNG